MRAALFLCNRQNPEWNPIAALFGTLLGGRATGREDDHCFDEFPISYAIDAGLPITEELVLEGWEIVTPSSCVRIAGPEMFEDYWMSLVEGERYFGDPNSEGAIEVLRQAHQCHPDKGTSIAVAYNDGAIRLWHFCFA